MQIFESNVTLQGLRTEGVNGKCVVNCYPSVTCRSPSLWFTAFVVCILRRRKGNLWEGSLHSSQTTFSSL